MPLPRRQAGGLAVATRLLPANPLRAQTDRSILGTRSLGEVDLGTRSLGEVGLGEVDLGTRSLGEVDLGTQSLLYN